MAKKAINTLDRDEIREALQKLRLPGMRGAFEAQLDNPAVADLTFEQRFGMMVYEEMVRRKTNRVERLIQESGITRASGIDIENVIYSPERGLDKAFVTELATCNWLRAAEVPALLITGSSGTGKTWLAKALGLRACHCGLSVAYYRHADLLDRLKREPNKGAFKAKLLRKKLLIIDDWGLLRMDEQGRADMLSIIDERHMTCGTIIAAQLPVEDWHAYINDPYTADSMMDRLLNFNYTIKLKGRSLRELSKPPRVGDK